MGDRFYGEVSFPLWAEQYLPKVETSRCVSRMVKDGVVTISDNEAKSGLPDVLGDLERIGLPYDGSTAEYFEYPGTKMYGRFAQGGKIDELVVSDSDDHVQAGDIVAMIDEGKSLADIRAWCHKTLVQCAPLTPLLQEITEQDWLAWVNTKAKVFRENVLALKNNGMGLVRSLYMSPFPLEAGLAAPFGDPGLLVTRPKIGWKEVSPMEMDEGERLFPGASFLLVDAKTAGVLIPMHMLASGPVAVVEYLEKISGNVVEPPRLLAS